MSSPFARLRAQDPSTLPAALPRGLRLFGLGMVCVMGLLSSLLSQPATGHEQQGPAPECDPVVALCQIDPAPWVAPQLLRYQGPAAATEFKLNWAQEADSGRAARIRIVDSDADTKTWGAILPPEVSPGMAMLLARTRTPTLQLASQGVVHRLVSAPRLSIARDAKRLGANLRFKTRGAVRAKIELRLRGRYPAEKSEIAKTWRLTRVLPLQGNKRLRLPTDNVRKRCRRYVKCHLTAQAKLSALGYPMGGDKANRSVSTPPERPTGRLDFIPGNVRSHGGGRRYDYAVYVEDGIKIDRKDFATQVGLTLLDSRGWTRTGRVAFRQVPRASDADTKLILASPPTVDRLCAPLLTRSFSSCNLGSRVVLNLDRWRYAVPHIKQRTLYRHYLVNHEMGHRIGQDHRTCPKQGSKAPVMLPQTGGLQGCKANGWPLDFEVASARRVTSGRASLRLQRAIRGPQDGWGWLD